MFELPIRLFIKIAQSNYVLYIICIILATPLSILIAGLPYTIEAFRDGVLSYKQYKNVKDKRK